MALTHLDLLLWGTGFAANAALLFVLGYRRQWILFPFFTALILLNVVRSIVLFFVLHYWTAHAYFYVYWSLALLDTALQLAVVYEIASKVFRPLNVWAQDLRRSFLYAISL